MPSRQIAACGKEMRVTRRHVCFVFEGLAHYYNYVLNRLDAHPELRVTVVLPRKSRLQSVGVHESRDGIRFNCVELDEQLVGGCHLAFRGLWHVLLRLRPSVLVVTPPHLRGLYADRATWIVMRLLRVRLALKSIPFRTLSEDELQIREEGVLEAALRRDSPRMAALRVRMRRGSSPAKAVARCMDGVLSRLRKLRGQMRIRRAIARERFYWNLPHAHLNYVDDAYRVYGSYGVPPERIFVTRNSPETDRLLEIHDRLTDGGGVETHPRRLVHVGRMVEWKRLDLVLEAVRRLVPRFPDVQLLAVGDGPQRAAWEALARELGVADRVTWAGVVYDSEALGRAFMSGAVYVLGGMGGLSINEAMCFGRPVVCSVCDGTERFLVRDGWNGYVFRDGDASDLTAKLAAILADTSLSDTMGERSLAIVRDECNADTVMRGYYRALEYLTGRQFPGQGGAAA